MVVEFDLFIGHATYFQLAGLHQKNYLLLEKPVAIPNSYISPTVNKSST
jgi:hypothetical protein